MEKSVEFELVYGMKVSKDNIEFIINRYWADDVCPMCYKVTLIPTNDMFAKEWYFSSDLINLINQGVVQVIN